MIIKNKKVGVKRMFDRGLSDEAVEFNKDGYAEISAKTGDAFLGAHPKDLSKSTPKAMAEAATAREESEAAAAAAEAEAEADTEES